MWKKTEAGRLMAGEIEKDEQVFTIRHAQWKKTEERSCSDIISRGRRARVQSQTCAVEKDRCVQTCEAEKDGCVLILSAMKKDGLNILVKKNIAPL